MLRWYDVDVVDAIYTEATGKRLERQSRPQRLGPACFVGSGGAMWMHFRTD
jgi:hypothetical protein